MKLLCTVLTGLLILTATAGGTYNFFMISDTHFGAEKTFAPRVSKGVRTRADRAMPVYRALFADMVKKSDRNTAFLIHAGDIIEGHGKTVDLQIEQFVQATDLLKSFFRFPIYYVRGNHENSGGTAAYFKFMLPEIARIAGKPLKTANYTVQQDKDLFIFVDYCDRKWQNFIIDTLKNLKTPPRYLFVIIHIDLIVPFRDQPTQELSRVLSRYNTLVLHGHSHSTVKMIQTIDGKPVTAFSIGTCLSNRKRVYKMPPSTDITKQLIRIRRQGKLNDPSKRKELFDRHSLPSITHFEDFSVKTGAQGYAHIHVSEQGVSATLQGSDLSSKPITVQLLPAAK